MGGGVAELERSGGVPPRRSRSGRRRQGSDSAGRRSEGSGALKWGVRARDLLLGSDSGGDRGAGATAADRAERLSAGLRSRCRSPDRGRYPRLRARGPETQVVHLAAAGRQCVSARPQGPARSLQPNRRRAGRGWGGRAARPRPSRPRRRAAGRELSEPSGGRAAGSDVGAGTRWQHPAWQGRLARRGPSSPARS